MAQVVYAKMQSVDQFDSAHWIEGSNESYESVKAAALMSAQDGDILMIGRRDTLGRIDPRMFCRVHEDGSSLIPEQRWFDIGLRELRIAQAIVADADMPADDAASLVAAEIGSGKPWAPWNATHDAILHVSARFWALAGVFGDKQFMEMANAYNATCA